MHLCFKFCFIGEKCSWPIEIFASKNAIFDDSTLSAFFNHKTKVTAKMHGYVRKLVKFWINQMPQIILFTFLVVHQKMVGKLDGETCNFQCNLKIYVKKTWFIYLFILKWYKILIYFAPTTITISIQFVLMCIFYLGKLIIVFRTLIIKNTDTYLEIPRYTHEY